MFHMLLSSNAAALPIARPAVLAGVLHFVVLFLAVRLTASTQGTPMPVPRDTIRLEISRLRDPAIQRAPSHVPPPLHSTARSLPPTLPFVPPIDLRFASGQSGRIELIRSELVRKLDGTIDSRPARSVFSPGDVDESPEIRGTLSPQYPEHLQRAGISGRVVLEYVVLPTGRADSASVRVIASTDPAFTGSVIRAVLSASFKPARRLGAPVSVLVGQTIRFRNR
jgi:TonB family protein